MSEATSPSSNKSLPLFALLKKNQSKNIYEDNDSLVREPLSKKNVN